MLATLSNLLGKSNSQEQGLVAGTPDNTRVYAVGDIHGRSDLLATMLRVIEQDAVGFSGQIILVCLGDYIDRGNDSKGVVDLLLSRIPPIWQTVFLRGNHEQVMLDFLESPRMRTEWLSWGGVQALESYGIAPYGNLGLREPDALAAEMQHTLDELRHMNFYRNTVLKFVCGSYLFVHAGVRPALRLDRQMEQDLLFIREDFIGKPHGLPYRVVFGHTILDDVLIEPDRIGLDTGAFHSGKLSSVCLEGTSVRVLQVTQ